MVYEWSLSLGNWDKTRIRNIVAIKRGSSLNRKKVLTKENNR